MSTARDTILAALQETDVIQWDEVAFMTFSVNIERLADALVRRLTEEGWLPAQFTIDELSSIAGALSCKIDHLKADPTYRLLDPVVDIYQRVLDKVYPLLTVKQNPPAADLSAVSAPSGSSTPE